MDPGRETHLQMIRKGSVILDEYSGPCCALNTFAGKKICDALMDALISESPACNYTCPFYKPTGCKDWIRVEEGSQILIVPPEVYFKGSEDEEGEGKPPTWKIRRVPTYAHSAEQH